MFLFNNEEIFRKIYDTFSRGKGNYDSNYAVSHEKKHVEKIKKYKNLEWYYGIRINILDINNGRVKFNITPTIQSFLEDYAKDNNLKIEKHVEILEDINDIDDYSSGDLKIYEAIEAIKDAYAF